MSSTHEIENCSLILVISSLFGKVNLREFNGWDAKKNQTRQHVIRHLKTLSFGKISQFRENFGLSFGKFLSKKKPAFSLKKKI